MAKRRMISKDIFMTQEFMTMSLSAQALYSWLVLFADDDGFVGVPERIAVMIGAERTVLIELINSGFIVKFETGVIVIDRWEEFNKVRKHVYKPTNFFNEKLAYYKSKLSKNNRPFNKVINLVAEN